MRPGQTIYLFIALCFAVVILMCCNPAKKVAKQQQEYEKLINDYLAKHPQQLDTALIFIQGGNDTVKQFIPVINTAALLHIEDSLKNAIRIKYADVLQDCDRQVSEAFNTGYDQARYEISQQKVFKPRPDTLIRTVARVDYENSLKEQISGLKFELKAAYDKPNYLLYLILSILLNLLLVTVIVKRK